MSRSPATIAAASATSGHLYSGGTWLFTCVP
jgi:hypothetical protein